MKVIKKQSKETYKNKNDKECHYYHYYLELENGKRIQIKPAFKEDYKSLDLVSNYVK